MNKIKFAIVLCVSSLFIFSCSRGRHKDSADTSSVSGPPVDQIAVADATGDQILIFNKSDSDDVAPQRTISGNLTELDEPTSVAYDSSSGELFVANTAADNILVFKWDDDGNVAPTRVIEGASTGLDKPMSVAVVDNEIYVLNQDDSSVTVYNTTDGDGTDSLIVADTSAKEIKFFAVDGYGDTAPTKEIGGSATAMQSATGIALMPAAE